MYTKQLYMVHMAYIMILFADKPRAAFLKMHNIIYSHLKLSEVPTHCEKDISM